MRHNSLLKGLRPTHPGEVLREDVLPALGRPKTEIADLLGISRPTLYDVLNEKRPITPNLALRIGKLVGGGPEIWLTMQKAYDLQATEAQIAKELEQFRRCLYLRQSSASVMNQPRSIRPLARPEMWRRNWRVLQRSAGELSAISP